MPKPICVMLADVHYSINTLSLADAATRMAIDKANELHVPLVIAGDLHCTKANLRGECVNAMVETFRQCHSPPYIIVGNHDKIHEKSTEHSLNFLAAYAMIIDYCAYQPTLGYLIPYHHDPDELRAYLKTLPKGSQLIMHQGIQGSNMGDYVQDKSAINKEDVADFRVISGHYHTRQDIKCGRPQKGSVGMFSYIGNPFTLSFGEANDSPKGFQILMNDGNLEFVPTNLREHRVLEYTVDQLNGEGIFLGEEQDLVWIKVKGTREELNRITRDYVASALDISQSFKLDLIPTDSLIRVTNKELTNQELMDSFIDSSCEGDARARLKDLWKGLCE